MTLRQCPKPATLALLCCVGWAGLLGCGAPIKVKTTDTEPVLEDSNARRRGALSRDTKQLLRLQGWNDDLATDPAGVMEALDRIQGEMAKAGLAAQTEVALETATRLDGQDREEAAIWYLIAAARSYEYMFSGRSSAFERAVDPKFQRMRRIYNSAVGSYLSELKSQSGDYRDHEKTTYFESFRFELEIQPGSVDPENCDSLVLTRDLEITGLRNRYRRPGVGASLVSFRVNEHKNPLDRFTPPEGIAEPVTAVLKFGPRRSGTSTRARSVQLVFYDPRTTESVEMSGWSVPLQADFTSHYAYQASVSDLPGLARKALLRPEDYILRQGLFMLEPYDPERIPVIMVHGLKSSPLAWAEVTNDLYGEPDLRSRYQIWHYMYPTGLPYLYAGMVMRSKLEAARVEFDPEGDDPAMQSMVILAHSMGGLVTRSLISDSGMKLWDTVFTVPPEELTGMPQDIEWLEDLFIFETQPYVSRVIFVATPHQGSSAATSMLGQITSSLVDLPDFFTERVARISTANYELATTDAKTYILNGAPNSIQALRPTHPILKSLGNLPIDDSIPYHTIMGNRGNQQGGQISDGWVTYESAHLEGAESELIVSSRHDAYSHPQAIAEIKRILFLHGELNEPPAGPDDRYVDPIH